jgi:hypothetical protein
MIDLATIAASIPSAFTAAKEAIGMAKSIRDLTSDTETKTAMSELLGRLIDTQSLILDAQGKMQEVSAYTREIEGQLAQYRNWDIEAGRYKLVEPYPGTFIYAKKDGLPDDEPRHYLCPACFQKRQKSFLQDAGINGTYGRCHQCDVGYQFRAAPRRESGGCY